MANIAIICAGVKVAIMQKGLADSPLNVTREHNSKEKLVGSCPAPR